MASKAKTIRSTDSTQPGTAVEERGRLLHSVSEQEIRERAYEIYLQRGAQPGYELEDWLQAEREFTEIQSASHRSAQARDTLRTGRRLAG